MDLEDHKCLLITSLAIFSSQITKEKQVIDPSQQVFLPALDGMLSMSEKTSAPLNHAEQVCRPEIY